MSRDTEHSHHVRRVTLPSGKSIEVVYFEELPSEPAATTTHEDELHVCGSCGSDLVYPIEWSEAGSRHWQVSLRCPNCEWSGTGVFDQDAVDRFDTQLDLGTEELVRDLRRVMQANMEDELERFTLALEQDLIQPEDF